MPKSAKKETAENLGSGTLLALAGELVVDDEDVDTRGEATGVWVEDSYTHVPLREKDTGTKLEALICRLHSGLAAGALQGPR